MKLSFFAKLKSQQLKDAIESGDLVLVTGNVPLNQQESTNLYKSGPSEWAEVFDPEVSKYILYGGFVSGYLYVNKCFIG